MLELLDQFRIEAPVDLWRGIGSKAVLDLADTTNIKLQEEFLGQTFGTRYKGWGIHKERFLLRVRRQDGQEGPASLLVISDHIRGEARVYTHYIFSAAPLTTSTSGYMARLPGIINPSNSNETRAALEEGLKTGTALCLQPDVEDLFVRLSAGVQSFLLE